MSGERRERVLVEVDVAAPPWRVWRALCDVEEVRAWDGARPLAWSDDYPSPGEHARWRIPVGAWSVVLHDRVQEVEPPERLVSELSWLWVHVHEEYVLTPNDGGTHLVSDNLVWTKPRWAWLHRMSVRVTRESVEAAMHRLAEHCEACR